MLSGTMVISSLQNPGAVSPEQQLIRRVQDGERELFYELVRPYERRVYTAAFCDFAQQSRCRGCRPGSAAESVQTYPAISRRGAVQHLADSDHGERSPHAAQKRSLECDRAYR